MFYGFWSFWIICRMFKKEFVTKIRADRRRTDKASYRDTRKHIRWCIKVWVLSFILNKLTDIFVYFCILVCPFFTPFEKISHNVISSLKIRLGWMRISLEARQVVWSSEKLDFQGGLLPWSYESAYFGQSLRKTGKVTPKFYSESKKKHLQCPITIFNLLVLWY